MHCHSVCTRYKWSVRFLPRKDMWCWRSTIAVAVVAARNSRGVFGADWGNKEVADLEAGVDWAIAKGIADPDRLGIGGWSYGGILTDYVIASDRRFKAAISGAGSGNQLSMYGSDQYVNQYDNELGPPWKREDTWIRLSYTFFSRGPHRDADPVPGRSSRL
jgi:dipeptidyl aminopeptidase/acylaminoacyl peptidase